VSKATPFFARRCPAMTLAAICFRAIDPDRGEGEARVMLLFIEQCLNGVQLGLLLFLLAAGLTLVFGIMDLVNLAHGSLYMLGAYFAATFAALTGSFVAAVVLALVATLVAGMALEVIAIRRLYGRDHLDHVLGTFGLILFFNELVRLIWGPAGMTLPLPSEMLTAVQVLPGIYYPLYRLVIILVTLTVAGLLYVLVMRTRIGMLIRAGASNREMVSALGVNIQLLFTLVFGLGAALAGFAGLMQAPILTVQIGMGENILILAFVVIIIGGIGSIRGAFVASVFVGLVDTLGRAFLPDLLRTMLSENAAATLAPALSSMMIYMLMAAVLVVRPEGLFPASGR
jgi:branched-chain amino acid transport system permease protein